MIEIEIPKDIKDYEPKFIGPFTLRKFLGMAGSVLVMAIGYNVFKGIFDNGLKIIIPLAIAIIPFLIGYYKPYGLPFEKYAIVQLNTNIIPPKIRKYKTKNLFEQLEKEDEKEELAKQKNAKKNIKKEADN